MRIRYSNTTTSVDLLRNIAGEPKANDGVPAVRDHVQRCAVLLRDVLNRGSSDGRYGAGLWRPPVVVHGTSRDVRIGEGHEKPTRQCVEGHRPYVAERLQSPGCHLTGDIGKAAELAVATGDQNDTDAAQTANRLAAVVDDINNDLDAAGIETGSDFGTHLKAFGRKTRKRTGSELVYAGELYGGLFAVYSLVSAVLAIFGVHLPPFPLS